MEQMPGIELSISGTSSQYMLTVLIGMITGE